MRHKRIIVVGLVAIFSIATAGYFFNADTTSARDDKKILLADRNAPDAETMDIVPFNEAAARMKIKRVKGGPDSESVRQPEAAGTDQGVESEPNNNAATADALTGTDGRIRGSFIPTTNVPATNDVDWYSFTTTVPNSKVYAATMTTGSGGVTDSVLAVVGTDGTTVLELDDQDGSAMGANSSTISGTTLAAVGTYYLRVTNFSTTSPIAPYDLYFAVRDPATVTAETEPNNNGTPQVLPASQYVSGSINPVGDTDTFTFNAAAGDTVFMSLDMDPERDVTTYDGRIGQGIFGTPGNFLVSSDAGTFDTIDSEAAVFTVRNAGSYTIYTDSQTAGGGGATATYNFTLTVIPALPSGTCTTYTSATTPTALPDLALTTSTISIPDSKIIRSLRVVTDISHTNIPDLDVNLRSPSNNDNGLFTDAGVATQTGAQVLRLDNESSMPLAFTVMNGVNWRAEPAYNLNWFQGENAQGTWSLDIRDDLTANTGTLNSWSLEVCEEPLVPGGNLIYSEDFEANNGGYTHTGTLDEWEYGTPATVGQTTTAPFTAPITTCASGTNCWKTDLDGTYENSASMDLSSPTLNLTQYMGTINLYWQQRYQFESVAFDRAWVRVTNNANPADTRIVWHTINNSMSEANGGGASAANHAQSAGWGRYSANISDFAGKAVTVTFHVESDTSNVFAGLAIDDVQLRHIGTTSASVPVSGRVLTANGQPISRTLVVMSDEGGATRSTYSNPFGYYIFDNVATGHTYSVSAQRKQYQFNPVFVTVGDEITGLDIMALP